MNQFCEARNRKFLRSQLRLAQQVKQVESPKRSGVGDGALVVAPHLRRQGHAANCPAQPAASRAPRRVRSGQRS